MADDNQEQVDVQRKFLRQRAKRDLFNATSKTWQSDYPSTKNSSQINSAQDIGDANMLKWVSLRDQANATKKK